MVSLLRRDEVCFLNASELILHEGCERNGSATSVARPRDKRSTGTGISAEIVKRANPNPNPRDKHYVSIIRGFEPENQTRERTDRVDSLLPVYQIPSRSTIFMVTLLLGPSLLFPGIYCGLGLGRCRLVSPPRGKHLPSTTISSSAVYAKKLCYRQEFRSIRHR
jgi:hypothetical protein